jgi:hypothetical protein
VRTYDRNGREVEEIDDNQHRCFMCGRNAARSYCSTLARIEFIPADCSELCNSPDHITR